jgi:CheY-like chemotaxis protein
MVFEQRQISLKELADEAIEIHHHNATSKGLGLSCRINPGTPERFFGDPKRLRQVLLNLIGNAVKFTDQGHVELWVSAPTPEQLLFSVSDTGIGIPEEKWEMIFEPFSQGDTSVTRQYGGVGLGLSLCKRLVEVMEGRIWVESRVGLGSRFSLSIPFSAVETGALNSHEREEAGLEEVTSEDDAFQDEGAITILLAEDVRENAQVIEAFLLGSPYRLDIVEDGSQVLDRIQLGKRYDLILMDIQMPGMDGLEATRRIRHWEEEKGLSRTPILALTAYAMSGDEKRSLEAGCDDHITKPISKKKLLKIIDNLTEPELFEP